MVADANQFVAELDKAKGALGGPNGNTGLAAAAAKSNGGLTVLRRGMVGLAMQATGTAGPVGTITRGLVQLGGGSEAVLAAAAGIGLVALAVRNMNQEMTDSLAGIDDLIKDLDGLGTHAQIAAAKQHILKDQLQLEDVGFWKMVGRGVSTIWGKSPAEANAALRADIAKWQGIIGQLQTKFSSTFTTPLADAKEALKEAKLGMENTGEAATRLAERVDVLKLKYQHFTPDAAAATAEIRRQAAEMKIGADLMRSAQQQLSEAQIGAAGGGPDVREARIAAFRALMSGASQDVADSVAQMTRKTRELMRQVANMDELRQIGVDAGKQFVMGMAEGMASLQDFLKSVFGMLMNFVLGQAFGRIFGAIGGSLGGSVGSAAKDVGGASKSLVAPQAMGLTLNMSGVQPLTAFAVSRDPAFQQLLREGLIVAASQGFKQR